MILLSASRFYYEFSNCFANSERISFLRNHHEFVMNSLWNHYETTMEPLSKLTSFSKTSNNLQILFHQFFFCKLNVWILFAFVRWNITIQMHPNQFLEYRQGERNPSLVFDLLVEYQSECNDLGKKGLDHRNLQVSKYVKRQGLEIRMW